MRAPLPPTQRGLLIAVCSALALAGCFGQSQQDITDGPTVIPEDGTGWTSSPGEPLPPFQPAELSIRKLLSWQYANSVKTLLGAEAANAITPPQDSSVNGFDSIGAAQLSMSTQAVDLYEQSAMAATAIAFADTAERNALVPCSPKAADDAACMQMVVSQFGRKAFRRPMTQDELNTWVAVGRNAGTAYGDFYKGAQFALAGLLQSPNFLYIVEVGEPDPAKPSRLRLTSHELATRLAFFLTGTLPDDELLAAADSGQLDSEAGVRAQAERLLEKPEARDALDHFFDEVFMLRNVDTMPKDVATFPEFTSAVAQEMHQESTLLFRDVVWDRDTDFRDVLDAPYTFVNPELANIYGLQAPSQSGWAKVDLDPSGKRGGFFGQGSFLALWAHPRTTSPTKRGKFIRERLLCGTVPAPPPNVNLSALDEPGGGSAPKTMRERLAVHQQNPSCAGCHTLMDGIGLGFENFDPIGRYRETENGQAIDAVSQFDDKGNFEGAVQMGKLLRDDDRVVPCLVKNVFRMATGHVEEDGEKLPLYTAQQAFEAKGYRMKSLLVEIAASDAFRYGKMEVQP